MLETKVQVRKSLMSMPGKVLYWQVVAQGRYPPTYIPRACGPCLDILSQGQEDPNDDAMSDGKREGERTGEQWGGTGRGSKEAWWLRPGCGLKRKKAVPSQPRSICPLRWRASLMRSGRRPFKSTDARQPWKPSREATSFGRLLYMPWARPAM